MKIMPKCLFLAAIFYITGCQYINSDSAAVLSDSPCSDSGVYQAINRENLNIELRKDSMDINKKSLLRGFVRTNNRKLIGFSLSSSDGSLEIPVNLHDKYNESDFKNDHLSGEGVLFYDFWISRKHLDGRFCVVASYYETKLDSNGVKRGYVFNEIMPLSLKYIGERHGGD